MLYWINKHPNVRNGLNLERSACCDNIKGVITCSDVCRASSKNAEALQSPMNLARDTRRIRHLLSETSPITAHILADYFLVIRLVVSNKSTWKTFRKSFGK